MAEYVPSPRDWVADQVELYEGSQGTDGLTLRDTGLPVIIVTNQGHKTGAIRKTPLMRVADGPRRRGVPSVQGIPGKDQQVYTGIHRSTQSLNRHLRS